MMLRLVKRALLSIFLISLGGATLVHLFDPKFAGILVRDKAEVSDKGEQLYAENGCPACHGAQGKSPPLKDYPIIAGQNAVYLFNQIVHIREGVRTNGSSTIMREAIEALTDDQARQIAAYLSVQ